MGQPIYKNLTVKNFTSQANGQMAPAEGDGQYPFGYFRYVYDFAVHGGAISTITLAAQSGVAANTLPAGAVVVNAVIDVITILTSGGSATVALQLEAANDIFTATAYSSEPFEATGVEILTPVFATDTTWIKTTAARAPKIVIGTAALTAGKFYVYLFYFQSSTL